MPWGISDKASEKEKIKSEFNNILMGYNSTGKIDCITYSELFDKSMKLFCKMYKQGRVDLLMKRLDKNQSS